MLKPIVTKVVAWSSMYGVWRLPAMCMHFRHTGYHGSIWYTCMFVYVTALTIKLHGIDHVDIAGA